MPRPATIVILAALAVPLTAAHGTPSASAEEPATAPALPPGPGPAPAPAPAPNPTQAQGQARDADAAKALLATIEAAATKEERLAAIARLAELGPRVVEPLAAYLKRPRATTPDERRAVLAAIKASVPDKSGRFQSPGARRRTRSAPTTSSTGSPCSSTSPRPTTAPRSAR